jgi:hypothetical protein
MAFRGRGRRLAAGCAAAAAMLAPAAGCGPRVDIKEAIQVTDVATGWYDAGIVDGKNKLVPSIAFRLKDVAPQRINSVELNVVFVLAPDSRELDDTYMRGIGSEGLGPNEASERFVVRAKFGFTGEQPRAEMLQHSQFADARVRIQAKHGSRQWVQLGEFPIERQLLTN